jgi:RNA 2',3'-cyclic 3'-phosphodiesterase
LQRRAARRLRWQVLAMTKRRLFFALWPDDVQRRELVRVTQDTVKSANGHPVPVENYHLTLAFLGAVADDAMASVRTAAENVSAACLSNSESAVLEVTLDQINFWHKPQILCATASRESPLAIELAETLKRHLINAGFAPDLKTFRAHVTLARKVARVKVAPHVESVRIAFRDFSLVESRSGPAGSIYSVIDSWPLCAR